MLRIALTFCGTLVLLALVSVSADAATYYVAPPPTGNDMNAGTQAAPFATIQKAATVANAGDTVIVAPGVYVGAKLTKSGTAELPIVFTGMAGAIIGTPNAQNANGDNLWLQNVSYVTVEGFEVRDAPRGGIAVEAGPGEAQSHGVVIRDNVCHDNTRWGIYASFAEGIRIEGNETSATEQEHGIYVANSSDNPIVVANHSHDNFMSGIQIDAVPATEGDDDAIVNAVVDSNVLNGNGTGGGAAILLVSVRTALVINNLLYDNHGIGLYLWDGDSDVEFGSRGNRVFNNTVVQPLDGEAAINLDNGSNNNAVNNNILIHLAGLVALEVDSTSEMGFASDFNVITGAISLDGTVISFSTWVARNHDAQSVAAAPADLFVSLASNDYSLKATSPAIDTGRPVTGVADDIRGVARPQGSSYDIGAYEFTTSTGGNENPVANAGADQTVEPGDLVGLNGSASTDPDGDTLTFAWQQLTGLNVALNGANTATPTFVAPEVTADTQLTFQLTVSDGHGGAATDTVSVTVNGAPPPLKIFVTEPNGGESWKVGKKKKITFTAEAGVTGAVRIEVSRDGGTTFQTIIGSVPVERGKKKWKVSGPTTTQALIRVTLISDPRVFGVSPAPFTIR